MDAKVEAVLSFPVLRFLGMVGYYKYFCRNFSVVVAPLTKLCSPVVPFVWTDECDRAFSAAKSLLCSAPVLAAPNFSLPFKLEVDVSATEAGAVLLRDGDGDVCHPVCYFSVKYIRTDVQPQPAVDALGSPGPGVLPYHPAQKGS